MNPPLDTESLSPPLDIEGLKLRLVTESQTTETLSAICAMNRGTTKVIVQASEGEAQKEVLQGEEEKSHGNMG